MAAIPIVPAPQDDSAAYFRNYTQLPRRLSTRAWWALRVVALVLTLTLISALVLWPSIGLALFWGVAIPLLPALFVVAPGLWRQVCPMATLNQLPRQLGITRGLELPARARQAAFGISVALFVSAVALRLPLLNHAGTALAGMLSAALLLALAGGLVFKGRSGWCGTFCPLAPIQRDYGQAPLTLVRNGWCEPCVGCQKNCYDFNPHAAVFSDVYDNDPRWSWQRRLFMGLLPGLVLGYFVQAGSAESGAMRSVAILALSALASTGVYALAVAFVPASAYRLSLAFAAGALAIFYVFAGPLLVTTLAGFAGMTPAPALLVASRYAGLIVALALVGNGVLAERHWLAVKSRKAGDADNAGRAPPALPPLDAAPQTQFGSKALRGRLSAAGATEVTDRETGITFPVAPQGTLLEAIEAAGLKIAYGCRAGVCGADAVVICAGAANLSPPTDDETATLARMGLEGRARLACMCSVHGPVKIDRDPRAAPGPASVLHKPGLDKARAAGVQRVVIVGDGVAGMTAAEALRRDSLTVRIEIVAHEPHGFYNRMGIGRLIYDDAAMSALALVPPDWADTRDATVHRGRVAVRLDRSGRRLVLDDASMLSYDRLILATGARSTPPEPAFLERANAFVLRSADDASDIRRYVHDHGARRAVVIGGGVLGVEAADALHKLGLKVTLLQRADRLMNAQLDEAGAARLAHYLESIGIQVVAGVDVAGYEGRPLLQSVTLAHGPRVRGDLFVACLGIQPNVLLAKAAGLAVGRGIKVDAAMRSTDPAIHAVGDCAEPAAPAGPLGLWPVGAAQATAAVAAIYGSSAPAPSSRMVLQLKCDGIDLRSWGEIQPRQGDEWLRAVPDDPAWWAAVVRDGTLVGGLHVGPPGSAKAFTKLLQAGDVQGIRARV